MVKRIGLSLDPVVAAKFGDQTNARLDALEKNRGVDRTQTRAIRGTIGTGTVKPATPINFTLRAGGGSRPPDGLPNEYGIYGWDLPDGGVPVDRYEVWEVPYGTEDLNLAGVTQSTEIHMLVPFTLNPITYMVRAISSNGVPSDFSDPFTYTPEDQDYSATESDKGIARLASEAEVLAGTDAETIVTPATLKNTMGARLIDELRSGVTADQGSDYLSLSPSAVGVYDADTLGGVAINSDKVTVQQGDDMVYVLPAGVAALDTATGESGSFSPTKLAWSAGSATVSLLPGAPTAPRTLLLPDRSGTLATADQLPGNASTAARGIVELATSAETTTGTDAERAVTPAGLKAVIDALPVAPSVQPATTTQAGIVELATSAETATGTDTVRAVTPAGVKVVADTKAPLSHTHTASQVTDFSAAIAAYIASTDTGWVDVTVKSGFGYPSFNERPQVRRIGKIVLIKGGFANTGIALSAVNSVGTLPAGFAPPINAITHIGTSVGAATASGFISSAGEVQVRTNGTLSGYYFFGGGMAWTID